MLFRSMEDVTKQASLILEENGFSDFYENAFIRYIDDSNRIVISFVKNCMMIYSGDTCKYYHTFKFDIEISKAMNMLYYLNEIVHMSELLLKYPNFIISECSNAVFLDNKVKFCSISNRGNNIFIVFRENQGGKRCTIKEKFINKNQKGEDSCYRYIVKF